MQVFIGIDLAWGEKNLSGFSVLTFENEKLELKEAKLLKSLNEIVEEIKKYLLFDVFIGVDAPLVIPNETGNRTIEKEFNKYFSAYKIAMLPVNRSLFTKFAPKIRSEELFNSLSNLGFERNIGATKVIFEVYPHATIAVCFNGYKILPYKRKKGRNIAFIKSQLIIYRDYLLKVFGNHVLFEVDIESLKGQTLKNYEDRLDSITSAYTLFFCKYNKHKIYQIEGIDTFITPL